MAKSPKKPAQSASGVDMDLLKKIVAATESGNHVFITQAEGTPLIDHVPRLIDVNLAITEGDKAAAKATAEGIAMVKGEVQTISAGDVGKLDVLGEFQLMSGIELPASRRGQGLRGGRANKYPFDKMEVGNTFFVPVSEEIPNPLKTLGSTVASANMRYAVETGQTKEVERTKRGPDRKAMVDASGAKIREKVTVPVLDHKRKYEIRSVKKDQKLGTWVVPNDGVIIARTK